jgi:hypothetical protein
MIDIFREVFDACPPRIFVGIRVSLALAVVTRPRVASAIALWHWDIMIKHLLRSVTAARRGAASDQKQHEN